MCVVQEIDIKKHIKKKKSVLYEFRSIRSIKSAGHLQRLVNQSGLCKQWQLRVKSFTNLKFVVIQWFVQD